MYIVILHYKASLDEIDKAVAAHREYLDENYKKGNLYLTGPKVPRDGGIFIVKTMDRDQLNEMLETDPFHQLKLVEYEIIEFNATKHHPLLDPIFQ